MNELDSDYLQLLRDIKENGVPKQTRNGKVLSLFGHKFFRYLSPSHLMDSYRVPEKIPEVYLSSMFLAYDHLFVTEK